MVVQELDLQTLSIMIAAASIVVGVIMGILSIRNFALSRKASLFTDFQGQAYDMEFMKALLEINSEWSWNNMEEFFTKYGPETSFDTFAKFTAIGSYFDGMGKLLRLKLIDVKHIPELIAISIITFWEKIGPISNEIAVVLRRPEAFSDIKYLYDAIHKLELPG